MSGGILTAVRSFALGGSERIGLRLASAWAEAGRPVTLLAGAETGPLRALVSPRIRLIRGQTLAAAVRDTRPDILFCMGNSYTLSFAAARLQLGAASPPVVVKISNALVRPDQNRLTAWGYRQWLRLQGRIFDHFIAMTPPLATEIGQQLHLSPSHISTIANPALDRLPALDATPRPPLVVGLGRLTAQKNFALLLHAFARLIPHIPDARLLLIGDGPERNSLTTLAGTLKIADRITFAGLQTDPLPSLAQARVLALSSDYEGMPSVAVEALACGTPVVATNCCVSLPYLVSGPELGQLVPLNDAAALAAALQQALTQPDFTPSTCALRQAAAAPYTLPHAATAYLALFDRLTQARL